MNNSNIKAKINALKIKQAVIVSSIDVFRSASFNDVYCDESEKLQEEIDRLERTLAVREQATALRAI